MTHKTMKKVKSTTPRILLIIMAGFIFFWGSVRAQEVPKASPGLPENINKIVTTSCMPCHSSTGGLLSRGKLNFSDWTEYSVQTQKEKAGKILKELNKGGMPPKSVREERPELIPTREQVDIIKKWSESLPSESK